jgi:YidC/Oxa1 family membrane protein insertase
MDQQRRLLTFTVLSFLILFGWMSIGPKLFPGLFPPPPKPIKKQVAKPEKPAEGKHADATNKNEVESAPTADWKLDQHPTKSIVIGSDDPQTGYGLKITLSSIGGGIVAAELNDPRYKALKAPKDGAAVPQLKLLGNHLTGELKPLATSPPFTGQLAIDELDERLHKLDREASLATVNWEVVATETETEGPAKGTTRSVTFGLTSPDGKWEIRKKYAVRRWENAKLSIDEDPAGYLLDLQITFQNLSAEDNTIAYDLQGPVGLPLENAENASKFRDVKFGLRDRDGHLVTNTVTVGDIVKAYDKGAIEALKAVDRTFQYVGLDTQYFTVLVQPQSQDPQAPSFLEFARPQVIEKNNAHPTWSELGLLLRSTPQSVGAGQRITHEYRLFLGPKRVSLLASLGAEKVIDYSGFLFIPASLVAGIASLLLWILNSFHRIGLPYGICIMLLTVLVRSCMFPISKKQAINAKRMKELQPRLQELKDKYGYDKQKFAEEQMKLFAETGFNPLGGCLPVLMQLPIFIGLYQALNSSVDLRRASFLWIDNLAAPDALFPLPFKLPFLGDQFNLLPVITTGLFLFQQKMFMPPPTDDQTRMQAKMFFWMTLLMGFMFYFVPAGLCVYFIASSLWSMGERKLLDRVAPPPLKPAAGPAASSASRTAAKPPDNFWSRLREKLEKAAELRDVNGVPVNSSRRQRDKEKERRKNRP